MTVIETISALREWRRSSESKVVLVPTMGALHEGHAALVREARDLAGKRGRVAATIFVNPLQFGPSEDFSRYPRTLEADLALCEASGADVVFTPPVEEVYFADRSISISEKSLSQLLYGGNRPGHFDGVCTVVAKLFNMAQPDAAVFGKKDFQQLAIIRRMVRDLNFPVEIHAVETVREADGLAMSSRNRYLSAPERAQAPALHAALSKARDTWLSGVTGAKQLLDIVKRHLDSNAPAGRVEYISIVDAATLQALNLVDENGLIALAVFFGNARLIDNVELVRR